MTWLIADMLLMLFFIHNSVLQAEHVAEYNSLWVNVRSCLYLSWWHSMIVLLCISRKTTFQFINQTFWGQKSSKSELDSSRDLSDLDFTNNDSCFVVAFASF